MSDICEASGCDKGRYYTKRYCRNHCLYLKKHGRLHKPNSNERFWGKVQKSDSCWLWQGKPTSTGYGVITSEGARIYAHRFSYELSNGEIPDGLLIDHICHNRLCVNPEHLRLATVKQNLENLRGANANSNSGLRGVYLHKHSGLWSGRVKHDYVTHCVGYFKTKEEANEAVIAKRNELFTHNSYDRKGQCVV